jgi:hypothetical protein
MRSFIISFIFETASAGAIVSTTSSEMQLKIYDPYAIVQTRVRIFVVICALFCITVVAS